MFYTNPIIEQFLSHTEKNPHKKIIIETSKKRISAKELSDKSLRLAINLSGSGFKKGDRVLILARPSVELVVFILGVMRLGGVIIIADPGMGQDVFKNRLVLANPQWVFGESIIFAIQRHPLIKHFLRKKGFEVPEISNLKGLKKIRLGMPFPGSLTTYSYKKLLTQQKDFTPDTFLPLEKNDEVMIVFTSGTTTSPKGVVHTVSSLASTIKKVADICNPLPEDILDSSLPHFLLLAVALGITAVISKEAFSSEQYFKRLTDYKPTILFGPPAEFIKLMGYCKKTNTQLPLSINKIFLGSAPIFSGFLKKLLLYIPKTTKVTCIYGLTEILPVATVDGRKKADWEGGGDLLGNFIPGVTHTTAEDGELLVRGDHLFRNYLGSGKADHVATGDLVEIKANELILIGRKKDMIIRGNFNIYPELYESTIQKIPGVAACAMVGVRNEKKEDEEIVLVIEPENFTNKEIGAYIKDQLISGEYSIDTYALPDKILVMKLPRSGRQQKIDKQKVREIVVTQNV